MQQIVGVAIKRANGTVFSLPRPNRHNHVIHAMAVAGEPTPVYGEEGFVTDTGKFLNRAEAGQLASVNTQYFQRYGDAYPGGDLYSEDLW